MDLTSLIEIVIAIIVVFFIVKFIVSPIIKIIVGIVILIVFIYILQKFFGFDINQVLSPFGISLQPDTWGGINLNWILGPANYYIDQIKNFISFILGNLPKNTN